MHGFLLINMGRDWDLSEGLVPSSLGSIKTRVIALTRDECASNTVADEGEMAVTCTSSEGIARGRERSFELKRA